jgi:hypothetical protein
MYTQYLISHWLPACICCGRLPSFDRFRFLFSVLRAFSENCAAAAMVQGKTKGLQAKAVNTRQAAKAAANTKKGKRHIAPKKSALVKQASLHQVRAQPFLFMRELMLWPCSH